ncbi:MAG TPA: spermidine synthase [Bacillota bacterium]
MATCNGDSERVLAEAGLAAAAAPRRVLIGGLGVGFTLASALAHPGVERVTVVEIEPAVIAWQRSHLAPWSGRALEDPRVEVVAADLVEWLERAAPRTYDAALLDIDNGPGWTVTAANARLYGDQGLSSLRRVLTPGGAAAFWSAAEDEDFCRRLARHFAGVAVRRVPRERGAPDVIYVATLS